MSHLVTPVGSAPTAGSSSPQTDGETASALRGVVFDLDGVVIDSWGLMQRALAEAVAACDAGPPPVDAFRRQLGKPLPRIAEALGLPPRFVSAYVEASRLHADLAAPFPGMVQGLGELHGRGLSLAVSTGKDRERTLEILDRFGLSRLFSVVLAGDDVRYGKPHPEGLERVLDRLGLTPGESLFVGDAVVDVECALATGVPILAVGWGMGEVEELAAAGASEVVPDVSALFERIRRRMETSTP